MQNLSESRIPNFAKIALAILEAKVETLIGKGAVDQLREPFTEKEIQEKILAGAKRSEKRFTEKYSNSDVADVLNQLPISDLPSMKLAIADFYDNPTDERIAKEFEHQLRQCLPKAYPEQQIITAAKDYFRFFWEEMTTISDIRDQVEALSVVNIQANTLESTQLLRAIDQKLGLFLSYTSPIIPEKPRRQKQYSAECTSNTPGLIIYLIDIGRNISKEINGIPANQIVLDALRHAITEMVQRSLKNKEIRDRYQAAFISYDSDIYDLFNGVQPISLVAKLGLPKLEPTRRNGNTHKAFSYVEKLLQKQIPDYGDRPTPVLCHITSGEYPGQDPEQVAKRIKLLKVSDGSVLVENVLVDDESILNPARDLRSWSGIHQENELAKAYAQKLFRMSSSIPESYRIFAIELGYNISRGTRMLYPGTNSELINLGIVMSAVSRGPMAPELWE